MKISVIIPVYNTKAEYLRECLNSLLCQQKFKDYEVIAVNDGSTNGCERIIEEFARLHDKLVYIKQENAGTSVARNTGLSRAKGDYIMFVDGDDFVSGDCLHTVYGAMQKRRVDILFFGYATSYTNREIRRVLDKPVTDLWRKDTLELSVLKGNPALGSVEVGAPWGKLIKHDIIRDNGLRYTEGLIKGQDTVFMLSVFEHCRSFSYLRFLGYHYRISDVSVSHRYNPDIVSIMEKTLGAYGEFVEKYHKPEEFAEAVRQKYYKVMLGEYLELFFLNKKNKAPEREKENDFLKILGSEPYSGIIEKVDPGSMGLYQRVLLKLLKKRNISLLFALKRGEFFLRDLVVRKYV